MNNASIGLGNIVDDENTLGANRDNVELVVWLDLGLLPVAQVPVDFSLHLLNLGNEESTRASIHPLVLNFKLEWNTSLELESGQTALFFEGLETTTLGVHGVLTGKNIFEWLAWSDEARWC